MNFWGSSGQIGQNSRSRAISNNAEQPTNASVQDDTFSLAAVGMARIGVDGRFLDVNDCLIHMVDYSREELLKKNVAEVTHPEDRQPHQKQLSRLLAGEIPSYSLDQRYYRKKGSILWIRLTVSLRRDKEKRPLYGIMVVQELNSDRRKQYVEASLNEADAARNAALHTLETIGEAAAITDLNGLIQDATPAFGHLCETSLEKLCGYNVRHFVEGLLDDPDDSCIENEIVDTVQYTVEEKHFDEPRPIRLKGGTVRWVIPHISNVFGKDQQLAGRLLVLRNVSGLKQAQMASAENERKYRELVEHANTSILRVGFDFSIKFVNEYALNFFGYSRHELEQSNLLETLVPPLMSDKADQHAFMKHVVEAPEITKSYDQSNQCRDGSRVWVHWTVRAIRDHQGAVYELLLAGTDITQRKLAELEAEHYRRRSRELADQLIETEKNERTQLAAYLHDNIIQLLSLSNIRLGGLFPVLEQKGKVRDVERLQGVRDLLTEAVQQCRSMMDRLVPALLTELGLGAALSHLAEKHQKMNHTEIHVEDRTDDVDIPSTVSAILFRSARELLMNALKYAGCCRIEITLWSEEGCVHLQVADAGSGFDVQILNSDVYDETGGFGLFDIRERLEGLGGRFELVSNKGEGTTASVCVPLSQP